MRRLTEREYQASIRRMFGDSAPDISDVYPRPVSGYVFSTDPASHQVGEAQAQGLLESAERVATAVLPSIDCSGQSVSDCAWLRLDTWAEIAFRRPAGEEDLQRLVRVAEDAAGAGFSEPEAVAVALAALLQHPRFLYLVESRAETPTWTLDGYERAARLAMTYSSAPPDDDLLSQVGALDGLERGAVVDRLMSGGRDAFHVFVREWLHISPLPTIHDDAVREALDRELTMLIDEAYESDDGLSAILRSPAAYVNSTLEAFYELPTQSSGPDDFRRVELPYRAGLLTHPLVLARASHGDQSSTILRGALVLSRMLCIGLGTPPANAMSLDPSRGLPAEATARQRFEARLEDPTCSACHSRMEPLGFALESFDGLGRFRTEIDGNPVDSVGEFALDGESAQFDGATQLAEFLGGSEMARACFVRQWATYSLGGSGAGFSCTLQDLTREWSTSGGSSIPTLLRAFAEHPSFVDRAGGAR